MAEVTPLASAYAAGDVHPLETRKGLARGARQAFLKQEPSWTR